MKACSKIGIYFIFSIWMGQLSRNQLLKSLLPTPVTFQAPAPTWVGSRPLFHADGLSVPAGFFRSRCRSAGALTPRVMLRRSRQPGIFWASLEVSGSLHARPLPGLASASLPLTPLKPPGPLPPSSPQEDWLPHLFREGLAAPFEV